MLRRPVQVPPSVVWLPTMCCGMLFRSLREYKDHQYRIHLNYILCYWGGCTYVAQNDEALSIHLREDHARADADRKRGICRWLGCNAVDCDLVKHVDRHHDYRPYVCPVPGCGHRAKRPQDVHPKKHSCIKPGEISNIAVASASDTVNAHMENTNSPEALRPDGLTDDRWNQTSYIPELSHPMYLIFDGNTTTNHTAVPENGHAAYLGL
ncbi:hypothetical protein K474DRAFT_762455 [Panus rudis PR-1116 ss-1]|nr:hypothetical protein K474DRAFT_762455 [Panus rudis PR-1116 ss-1]